LACIRDRVRVRIYQGKGWGCVSVSVRVRAILGLRLGYVRGIVRVGPYQG
jgi:hypothetical protein